MSNSYEISIEYGAFHQIRVAISVNGKRMSAFSPELPSAFRQLARQTGAYQTIENELTRALEATDAPVCVRLIKKSPITVYWDASAHYTLQSEVAIVGDGVTVRHGAVNHAGDACVIERLGPQLIIDTTHMTLGRLSEGEPTMDSELTARFRKRYSGRDKGAGKGDDQSAVPRQLYNQDPLAFATVDEAQVLRFANESTVSEFRAVPATYRLNFLTGSDDGYSILQPCIGSETDSLSLFDCVTPVSKIFDDFPIAIATQSWRRSVFSVVAMALLSGDINAESLVAEIRRRQPNALPPQLDAVTGLIDRWLAVQSESTMVALAGRDWHFHSPNWRDESLCITLPMIVSDEVAIDDRGYVFPSDYVQLIAESLGKHLESTAITMTWNQTPIHFEHWDISADLTEQGDTYILDPVIQGGNSNWRDNWGDILGMNGMIAADGSTIMLSSETVSALRALLRYAPNASKTKGKTSIALGGRLRILDILHLVKSGVKVNLPEKDAAIIQSLLAFDSLQRRPIPNGFMGELREYQRSGFEWLAFLYDHRFGACLADDMGLGKTIQAIVFLMWQHELNTQQCNLVVVPPSLVYNWRNELNRFAPSIRVKDYLGSKRELNLDDCDVVLTTYDIVRRDVTKLAAYEFGVIIFDEAQIIKNMLASRSAAVRQLKGKFKVCLTGTPLENHAGEFVSILEVAVPGITDGVKSGPDLTANLIDRARPFVLRRTKEKILKELPEKIETTVVLPLSDSQKAYYQRILVEVREQVKQVFEKYRSGRAGILAITALLRLRQLCISPKLIDAAYHENSPKVSYLLDTLLQLQDEGHSALVFTQFRSFADLLAPALESAGIRFIQIDGTTPVAERRQLIEKFQHSDHSMVALMTLKTGGIGLNLVKASYVFHVDPWWNPAAENQASDRAHRIGQTQKVNVIRLIMQNSIEERVMTLKDEKQKLFDDVVNNGMSRSEGNSLTRDDFQFLLGV